MQPMPNKNRPMIVVGTLVLVIMLGAGAIWSATRHKQPLASMPINDATTPADTATTPAGTNAEVAKTDAPNLAQVAPSSKTTSTLPEYHTVAVGDTLSGISRMYYNSNIYAGDIEALNQLEDPNKLMPGKKLLLPKREALNLQ
jgi:LysM repeat protein